MSTYEHGFTLQIKMQELHPSCPVTLNQPPTAAAPNPLHLRCLLHLTPRASLCAAVLPLFPERVIVLNGTTLKVRPMSIYKVIGKPQQFQFESFGPWGRLNALNS